ncbi:hypothetical protein [uncultured Roseobacter sp.]|uniref:hypothetical protein n=1 Tax=uncultured Roseobacter sp. TaxID=114847 RepID=UPI00261ABBE3|nr:hypothetical protein [uncultured Roseobacter sp.]
MTGFRYTLITMTVLIVAFTVAAIANGGINLIAPFLTPILSLSWQGQFNIDFACYLILSGIWMAWRGGFSSRSIALGVFAPPLGILFFAPYLIYLVGKSNGDPRQLLLGVHA